MVKDPASIARYLVAVGEATEVPCRSAGRGPAEPPRVGQDRPDEAPSRHGRAGLPGAIRVGERLRWASPSMRVDGQTTLVLPTLWTRPSASWRESPRSEASGHTTSTVATTCATRIPGYIPCIS